MNRAKLTLVFVLASILGASSLMHARTCSPEGTWYGGAEGTSKYLFTIVPLSGNTYSVRAEGAYTLDGFGVVRETTYHGKMVKVGARSYRYRLMELLVWGDTGVPPADGALEIDVTEGILQFQGCNEATYSIYLFAYYLGWGKEPFVDPPDGYLLPPGLTIDGTMRRLAMD